MPSPLQPLLLLLLLLVHRRGARTWRCWWWWWPRLSVSKKGLVEVCLGRTRSPGAHHGPHWQRTAGQEG